MSAAQPNPADARRSAAAAGRGAWRAHRGDGSGVDELLAERRSEVALEDAEDGDDDQGVDQAHANLAG